MSWFYAKHGKQEGPVDEADLRAKLAGGDLSAEDLVWREGMAEWQPAGKIPELAPGPASPPQQSSALGAGPGVPSGPAPPTSPAPLPASVPPASGAPAGTPTGGTAKPEQAPPGPPGLVTPPPTSGLAITSMVCGIISIFVCFVPVLFAIPAVVCGHLALKAINENSERVEGRGMAMAGLVTGYFGVLVQLFWIFVIVLPSM